jgi:hypothetical protein
LKPGIGLAFPRVTTNVKMDISDKKDAGCPGDRLKAISLEGKPGHLAFVGATALAIVIVVALVLVGRMGYARADFTLLPPNYDSPAIPELPPGSSGSPPSFTYGTLMGSPQAPVTMVVYSDFLCGSCQEFATTTEDKLENAFIKTGQVRLVYKNFPVFGDKSILVAEAAESAAEQNKFWPYHHLLMQTRLSHSGDDITIDTLEKLAGQVGLDITMLDADLRSGRYRERVLDDQAEALRLGITGPPGFFVNRMKGIGNKTFEAFQTVITEQLERSADR